MTPTVTIGTTLPWLGIVVEICNDCVVVIENGVRRNVSFADVENSLERGKSNDQSM